MSLKESMYDGTVACAVGVTDLAAATKWYTEVLGFKHLYTMAEHGWCELQTHIPGMMVGLSQREEVKVGGGAVLTFGVKNIEEAHEGLKKHGTKFDGDIIVVPEMVKLVTFFDPDGNTFMLAEDLTKKG